MKTQQPSYWCIENIGDADPLECGGGFVIVDRTGVYDPQLLILDVIPYNEFEPYSLNSIVLEPLIRIKAEDGFHGLSDNKFHPDLPVWFGDTKSLQAIADFSGRPYYALLDSFLSSCPIERAFAYMDAVRYFGAENFNSEPREITHEKADALCDAMLAQIKQTKTWHIGYGVQ